MNRVYWLKGTSSENFQFTDEGFLSISNQKKKKIVKPTTDVVHDSRIIQGSINMAG